MPTQCNEYAFHIINDDSAYWAGFLFADGNITMRNNCQKILKVGLQLLDIEHLIAFRDFMQTNKRIGRYQQFNKTTNKTYYSCHLHLFSDYVCDRLINLGLCYQRIPSDELATNRNFWRGCIDGDGHIRISEKTQRKHHSIILLGTPLFLAKWVDYIRTLYPNTKAKINRHGSKLIHKVDIHGECARTVLGELYSDVNYVLMRKYIRAWSILNAPAIQSVTKRVKNQ